MERLPFSVSTASVAYVLLYTWSMCLGTKGQGIEYVYYTDPRSWNEARNVCQSIGGELAKIDSQQTIDDIKKLALDAYPAQDLLSVDFWIGLYDSPSQRREWSIDCTELTFTSNYIEDYRDSELCFKMRAGDGWIGYSKICAEDTPFLCELHTEGPCSFRYEMKHADAYSVSGVNDYGVCENHCAYDVTCSVAVFVTPSVCYKIPYDTSAARTNNALATISSNFCTSFQKNDTIVNPWENRLKYPVDVCGSSTINSKNVSIGASDPSVSASVVASTPIILPSSSLQTEQSCSTLVVTELVTSPCQCKTSLVMAIETVTELQMTTIQPSSQSCICTGLPETTTAVLTLAATTTLTQIQMTTVEIIQQCSTQRDISPVTVQITATPSCSLPPISVTPFITAQPPPYITEQKAEQLAEELSRNLTIDVKKTSAHRRSLISAPDDRKTSQAMGTVGIVCIAVPLAVILSSDIRKSVMCIKRLIIVSRFVKTPGIISYQIETFSPQNGLSASMGPESEHS